MDRRAAGVVTRGGAGSRLFRPQKGVEPRVMKQIPKVILAGLCGVLLGSGCQTCELKNTSISARVVRSSISAPPGGPARRYLEVRGSGFHPNVEVRVALDLPKVNGSEKVEELVWTDSQGSVVWQKEPVPILVNDPAPNTQVLIGVSETKSRCFGATHLLRSDFGP